MVLSSASTYAKSAALARDFSSDLAKNVILIKSNSHTFGFFNNHRRTIRFSNHVKAAIDSSSSDKPKYVKTLASNLFYPHQKLPPDGRSMFVEDEFCDPEEKFCKEHMHIYEEPCDSCGGVGTMSFRTKKGKKVIGSCVKCTGLGYTRTSTVRVWPDFENGSGKLTLQRPPEDAERRAKLEKKQKK
mmetsp:Transcript_24988/g.34439  ORF Transcript_24988/g.34439 Transcript_24988/m.34439 type:complete len:186 (+) Transcript_24988:148-705(+)|eukprot:CAMPEP_0196588272 /NCGR_PEP_ID=MMETSP1081-20130531/60066_1 /TAXON_ID=36882 /ORGANISM="Pyramimonas amylifera, Strain CCMP720" /LENGTH=185 /DNA_ID=CAMNT_0041910721 /DNA_START=142 /DNA_END=699 /DNA_ORIENTATION=+